MPRSARRHDEQVDLADASTLLKSFTPDALPVMSTLAKEFAIFDKCSDAFVYALRFFRE